MSNKFYRVVSLVCAASLLWIEGGAEASAFLVLPQVSPMASYRHFLRNEEKMRLETEALSEQAGSAIDGILAAETRPYWVRWINPARISLGAEVAATGWMVHQQGTISMPSAALAVGALIIAKVGFSAVSLTNEWGHIVLARFLGYLGAWTRENAAGNLPWTAWGLRLLPFTSLWTRDPFVRVPELEKPEGPKAVQHDRLTRKGGFVVGTLLSLIPLGALALVLPAAASIPLLAGAAVGLIVAGVSDLVGRGTPGIYNCGNLIYSGKLPLDQLMELLRPSLIDLLNRGNYSFGYSFMIPVRRKVPKHAQIPGFEVGDEEVIVWEYRVKKVWVPKRTGAVDLAMDSIREEMTKAYEEAAYIPDTMMFSFHSRLGTTGILTLFPRVWRFLQKLYWTITRKSPAEIEQAQQRLRGDDSGGETVQDLEEAAQPAITPPAGRPEEWELRQFPEEDPETGIPQMISRYVLVAHVFQFNGDISGTKAIHETQAGEHSTGNTEARLRFGRWLGYTASPKIASFRLLKRVIAHLRSIRHGSGKIAPGDAPLEVLQQKIFTTERLWLASIRYALFTYVISPDDARDQDPPFEYIKQWNVLFQQAFQKWQSDKPEVAEEWLKKPKTQADAEAIQARMAGHAAAFSAFLANSPEIMAAVSAYLPTDEERHKLFINASLAYWRNTLEYAVLEEMKPRMEGTEAFDASSTLNPPGSDVSRVETSQGQNLVAGLSKDGKVICVASDRIVLPAHMVTHRVKIESHLNSSVLIGTPFGEPVTMMLTRGLENKVITNEQARADLIQPVPHSNGNGNGNGNGHLPELPPGEGILEQSARQTAVQIPLVNEKWKAVHARLPSVNSTPTTENVRVFMKQRIYRVIKAYLHSNGLPQEEMDAWAWEQAEPLSRDSWNRTKSEADIMEAIAALARTERLRVLPGSPDPYRVNIPEDHAIDGIIVATGKTKLAAEKEARSLWRSTGLRLVVYVGNELIALTDKHGVDVDGFLYEVGATRHTPFILETDSGAETYEPNILKAYLPFATEELFGYAGSGDNQLIDSFGPERVTTTFNEGSKTHDGLPAYGSMVQTLEEFSLFTSENITSRFTTGTADWRKSPFFRTPFTHEQVTRILRPSNDYFAQHIPERLLGYTPSGSRLETTPGTNDSANLRVIGHERAERQLELARKWVKGTAYAVAMIVLGFSGVGLISMAVGPLVSLLGHGVGFFAHAGLMIFAQIPLVGPLAVSGVQWSASFLNSLAPAAHWVAAWGTRVLDACLDIGISFILLIAKRWFFLKMGWGDTQLFEGFGLPTYLFISPYSWVHDALKDIARAAQGLAYTITKSYFDSTKSSVANDDFRAVPNRNSIAIVFRPSHDHQALKFWNEEADQIGRHLKTQASLILPDRLVWLAKLFSFIKPTPPKVIDVGTSKPVKPGDIWGRMAFTSEQKTTATKLIADFTGMKSEDIPYHVVEYWLEQYDSFTWFLLESRVIYSQLHEVSKGVYGGLFSYPEGRFFGGGAVKSTQASAPGSNTLIASQILARTVPRRLVPIRSSLETESPAQPVSPSPVTIVEAAVWKAWPMAAFWLQEAGNSELEYTGPQPAPRLVTVPAQLNPVLPSATQPAKAPPVRVSAEKTPLMVKAKSAAPAGLTAIGSFLFIAVMSLSVVWYNHSPKVARLVPVVPPSVSTEPPAAPQRPPPAPTVRAETPIPSVQPEVTSKPEIMRSAPVLSEKATTKTAPKKDLPSVARLRAIALQLERLSLRNKSAAERVRQVVAALRMTVPGERERQIVRKALKDFQAERNSDPTVWLAIDLIDEAEQLLEALPPRAQGHSFFPFWGMVIPFRFRSSSRRHLWRVEASA